MTRAQDRAARVRPELGLHGQVDAETVANRPGLEVWAWPFRVLQEMQAGDLVAGAQSLGLRWQRLMIAYTIGHKLLPPGNYLWMLEHTLLGGRVEREADEFMVGLLMDGRETLEHGRIHFGTLPSASAAPRRCFALMGLATGPQALPRFEPPDCLTSPDVVPHPFRKRPQPPVQGVPRDSTLSDRSAFSVHAGRNSLYEARAVTCNPKSRLRRPLTMLLPFPLIDLAALVLPSAAHAQATPNVSSVSITSSPGTDNTYAAADTIAVSLTFSEAVKVTGTPYAFTASDFNFSATTTGDTLASVRILTLAASGKLALGGGAVTANQSVTMAQLDAGNLVYAPPSNTNGTGAEPASRNALRWPGERKRLDD